MNSYDKVIEKKKCLRKIKTNRELLELYNTKNSELPIDYFSKIDSPVSTLLTAILVNSKNDPIEKLTTLEGEISKVKSYSNMGTFVAGLVNLLDSDSELESDEEFKEASSMFDGLTDLSNKLEDQYNKLLGQYCSIIDIVKGLCKKKSSNYQSFLREQENIDEITRQLYPTRKEFEEYNKEMFSFLESAVGLLSKEEELKEIVDFIKIDVSKYLQIKLDKIYN